jgi:nitrile hydratase accessory protein
MSAREPSPEGGEQARFREPWEARAFALVLALHEGGLFAWSEWTAALSREIHAPAGAERAYYRDWLAALESLVVEKGAASRDSLAARAEAWARAARATPHGAPILLANDPQAAMGATSA